MKVVGWWKGKSSLIGGVSTIKWRGLFDYGKGKFGA